MKKSFYLAVAGTMGVGKSTAARLLANKLGFTLLAENFDDNQFLPRFYKNMKRWAFHSQTFFLLEKARQTLQAKEFLAQGKSIVQDTPIIQDVQSYAQAQFVLGNMDQAEFALYTKIYTAFVKHLPQPDLVVYLDGSLVTFKQRIKNRDRDFEQQVPDDYLALLDKLNRQWVRKFDHAKVLRVKTDKLNLVDNKNDIVGFVSQVEEKLGKRRRTPKLNGLEKKLRTARAILMCGLPGSGKSTLARRLSVKLGATLISSDAIRKKIFRSVRYEARGDKAFAAFRPKYYALLLGKVGVELSAGKKVIIDATNMDQNRLQLIKRMQDFVKKQRIVIVKVRASKQVIAQRMRKISDMANKEEDMYTGWERVYGYYEKHLRDGSYFWPQKNEGVQVIEVSNE